MAPWDLEERAATWKERALAMMDEEGNAAAYHRTQQRLNQQAEERNRQLRGA